MEVGQSGKLKIGGIIQVRYSSSRLPGKALKPLPVQSSICILERIVKKMESSSLVDEVIIATSDEASDDTIEAFAKNRNIKIFRGDLDNVLNRYVSCAEKFGIDIIIRKTGDNPISFSEVIENSIQQHINNKNDYTRNIGLPLGTGLEIVNLSTLKRIQTLTKEKQFSEHVTLFVNKHPQLFKRQEILNKWEGANDLRLTIDYPSDYALFNIIFQLLDLENKADNYSKQDIEKIFLNNKWLLEINHQNDQKRQPDSIREELEEVYIVAEKLEYNRAVSLIKKLIDNLEEESVKK